MIEFVYNSKNIIMKSALIYLILTSVKTCKGGGAALNAFKEEFINRTIKMMHTLYHGDYLYNTRKRPTYHNFTRIYEKS